MFSGLESLPLGRDIARPDPQWSEPPSPGGDRPSPFLLRADGMFKEWACDCPRVACFGCFPPSRAHPFSELFTKRLLSIFSCRCWILFGRFYVFVDGWYSHPCGLRGSSRPMFQQFSLLRFVFLDCPHFFACAYFWRFLIRPVRPPFPNCTG